MREEKSGKGREMPGQGRIIETIERRWADKNKNKNYDSFLNLNYYVKIKNSERKIVIIYTMVQQNLASQFKNNSRTFQVKIASPGVIH